jgi:uncharacterized membrane protein SpoIIM required for sporulation
MEVRDKIRSARFREEREKDWKALERLVASAEKQGVAGLSYGEARDLSALYQQATTSLAIAREISLDRALLNYLEALTARAYLSVYAPQQRLGGTFGRFFRTGAPAALRRSWIFILVGFLTMALGGAVGYALFMADPAWYDVFMPPSLADGRGPGASTAELRRSIYQPETVQSGLGAFATALFSHNTRIAIFVFGLGAFLCFPAILLTFYNGLILGAFVALHVDRGLGLDIFAWLSIHGVTELSAICIACSGGVQLGAAILFPGDKTRARALHDAGKDATKLALVAALMLLVAALLEGYGRQLIQDIPTRLAIGWGIGALWLCWALLAGRSRS